MSIVGSSFTAQGQQQQQQKPTEEKQKRKMAEEMMGLGEDERITELTEQIAEVSTIQEDTTYKVETITTTR